MTCGEDRSPTLDRLFLLLIFLASWISGNRCFLWFQAFLSLHYILSYPVIGTASSEMLILGIPQYGSTRFRKPTEAEKRHRRPWSPNVPTVVEDTNPNPLSCVHPFLSSWASPSWRTLFNNLIRHHLLRKSRWYTENNLEITKKMNSTFQQRWM